jgi:hypothetical protein
VTKVLHNFTRAAIGSSKKQVEAIDSEPKLRDEAAGESATRSTTMSIGDSKSTTSVVMSATKKVRMAGLFLCSLDQQLIHTVMPVRRLCPWQEQR